ncbi:MAG: hypothetical protein H6Q36_538 [Chloroflexi bacterium]|nr:hypothetical protein [Chloroflexota bacterium]
MSIDELPEASGPVPVPHVQPVQPVQPIAPKGRSRGSAWGTVLLGLAAVIAVGGIAFAAGRITAPASTASGRGAFPGGFQGGFYPGASLAPGATFAPDANGRPGGLFGAGGEQVTISGTVSAISGDTLTLATGSGQTVEVGVADATWHGQTNASGSDATVGSQVQVLISGGFGRNPGAGQVPGASPDPNASAAPGTGSITASEVTILQK